MPPANNFVNFPCTFLYNAGFPNTNINVCLIADAIFWGGLAVLALHLMFGGRR